MTGPDFHHERSRIAFCFGYNPKVQGEHLTVQLLWGATWLLVTCVSLIYIVDEFFFLLLVKLNKMRWLNEGFIFLFLVLIRGMMEGGESTKISLCYSSGLGASLSLYMNEVAYLVHVECF